MRAPPFTADDADRAHAEWGCNCGPGAVAAIMGMTLDQVRPFFDAAGFAAKRYTNPSMMEAVLKAIGRPWRRSDATFVHWGLIRVQWEGPWTKPGVPARARYRHTHWIGATEGQTDRGVFDINALGNGTGWSSFSDWAAILVPWLLKETTPRADGNWHLTHLIEVMR